ncbi:Bug family tripartite tricarboxylate transporter substrate binding protein [Cupriavidus oxalaticus]|uniref:Bug family tripartite tricarboxylate transporter substrate binding protein n=1 Tax=Cupriavidus oxalaticus TaxID=96344 RepID=UPI0031769D98
MTMTRRQFLASTATTAAATSAGLAALPGVALAQSDTARILVGFPPGGTPDVLARRLAEKMQGGYAKAVIVDNRAGAAGQIAAQAMRAAAPDGNTMLLTPMSILGVYPHTYKHLSYDPRTDLVPVTKAVSFDYVLAVGPAVPDSVRTVPEFLAWCKANPGKASFGSPATGSTLHFIGILLGRAAGVELTHIGFRGTQAALLDLVGGQIPAVCGPLGEFMKFASAGKCRVLGTSGASRSRFFPNVPTFVEQGYKGMAFSEWYGFFLPARSSAATIQNLNAAVRTALSHPDVVESLAAFGLEPAPSTPADLDATLRADTARWAKLVASVGFTAES